MESSDRAYYRDLEKYQHDLREFEQRYDMESAIFYQRF